MERLLGAEAAGDGDAARLGQAVLYFGCRRSDQDLYGTLLERWADEGKLTLFTAFSRQQVAILHNPSQLNPDVTNV